MIDMQQIRYWAESGISPVIFAKSRFWPLLPYWVHQVGLCQVHPSSHQMPSRHLCWRKFVRWGLSCSSCSIIFIPVSTAHWLWVRVWDRCHSLWNVVLYTFVLDFVIMIVLCHHRSRYFKKWGMSNIFKFTPHVVVLFWNVCLELEMD